MTSEQRTAHFRMPEHLFAELAAGGGSAQAVAFLERGERARRLLLLRTLLDHLVALPTPLTPAAEAWRVLKEAAQRTPERVEALLLAPTTGAWIAHMLRRVHGTANGPPLWAEAGRLNALATVASLHAGTETLLRVALTDGALPLPGLGTARLPDGADGLTTGRASTRAGELTLTGPDRTGRPVYLTCRPAAEPIGTTESAGDSCWSPLRTLTHTTPSGPVAIPLEDLDPYRDLDDPLPPARLDADEALAWQRLFTEATEILATTGGTERPGRLDPAVIRSVVPWARTSLLPPPPPDVRVSASSGDSYGAMLISRPSCPLALAETLVHEFQHSKLAALIHLFPLVDDDRAERYYAPWRPDPRHLTGLLHGAYAFTGVAGFWRDRLDHPEHGLTASYHFALRRTQSRLVVRTLLTSGRLTGAGHSLVSGLARTLDGWLREPVDPAALARARLAAALHRTEWRLRNIAPPEHPEGGDPTRFLPDRAPWPDVRTHAFAVRPADPRTPDEHLAAGDPAAALDGYAEGLAREPGDPHLLAGWIVARGALERGPETRRLLARPELLP
ncbi:HEXXH motif domain-containing protein [Streptomyces griseoloalbus]|uniref:HEXXH motif-containing protein n=1 Tax=Streptomyces griseoloalbus TaxID=67303 RepID=A0A7W8F7A3_9ACTN|nr:HEXXH motif domain-containing protein [Streptomyces albaduncus]MBB5124772.1 HEXXH motif-containing protein [Streptomyces albaduncus]GGV71207.1 HEXXH motif domain-containing protein [Streptomyces griseoloalbus]GGW39293.1 HEXXH motif domain-containing protein [Streptomyces albaduncus]